MNIENSLQGVLQLFHSGQMTKAEELCMLLLQKQKSNLKVQWLLFEIYLTRKEYEQLLSTVALIVSTQSDSLPYIIEIAEILLNENQQAIAQNCYLKYLDCHPSSAVAYYKLAHLQYKAGLDVEAIKHYQCALDLKIEYPETLHVDLANIYSKLLDEQSAKKHLKLALGCNNQHIPALFNLATLYEEWGERQKALSLYHKIIEIEPKNIEVIARIINAKKSDNTVDEQLQMLERLLLSPQNITQIEREAGHFALGKAFDERFQFDLAFKHYTSGNYYCKQRSPEYIKANQEKLIESIINMFDSQFINKQSLENEYSPIFVCGMFRSGTSLTEQILASHSNVSSGGELTLLSDIIKRCERLFPREFNDKQLLRSVAQEYQAGIKRLFPSASVVTDKNPNNFIYLGLLKTIFPNAKFVCTIRNPLDVCLSVYFQHLSNQLPYGHDLLSIAHYFNQYVKILMHWKSIMPDNLHIVEYETLVDEQAKTTKKLLKFCNLPWQEHCLEFHKHKNTVKTASVWQVRRPMYQTSVFRHRHYAEHLSSVVDYFDNHLPENYIFALKGH